MSDKISMNDGLLDHFNRVEKTHWWWEGRRSLIKMLTRDIYSYKKIKILDLGCGTGETMTFMKTSFPKSEVYGIDTSSKAIKFTKSRGHKNALLGDILNIKFKKIYFDVILILDVLEHIEKDVEVLNECKNILKKDGRIIVTCPAMNWMWSKHDQDQGHVRRYDKTRMRYLAEKCNLKLSFLSYFNFLLSAPIIIIRLLSRAPVLGFLANYDNSLNYNIVYNRILNNMLTGLFVKEIKLLNWISFPYGISMIAVFKK